MKTTTDRYFDIIIEVEAGEVKTSELNAQLYFDDPEGCDSVRWILKGGMPGDAVRMLISWQVESPFLNLGLEIREVENPAVLGTGNTRVEGLFKYSILFLTAEGDVVWGIDPWIKNDPIPPQEYR